MFRGKIFLLVLITVLTLGLLGIPTAHGAYTLVWSDEFDGSAVNTANWTFETGGGGWGNNELQYYRAENATVSGGVLTITAKKENYGGYAYTSARLKTQNKRTWTYGRIEARLQVPQGQGYWPAFWMLGNNFSSVGWPACGEIDIMECVNTTSTCVGTIHWNSGGHVSYGGSRGVSGMTGWHTYSIEWTPSSIKWFVDGVQYHEANIANSINSTEEFHRPFFLILNFAVGGNWPGSPSSSTVFPAAYKIDYVRVYQDNGGTPTPPPSGGTVSIRCSANNLYASADLNVGNYVIGNRSSVSTWEQFTQVTNSDGTVSFRASANGMYVSADTNLGGRLIANRSSIGTWEKFRKINNSNGTVSLQALSNNMYVCCDLNESAYLIANRSSAGTWEQFTIR